MSPHLKYVVYTFFCLFLLDQASKYLIRHYGGFYVCNSGIGLGIPVPSFVFWILWIAVIVALLWFLRKKCFSQKYIFAISLTAVLSGAFSNGLDRIYFGCVIDFIDLKIWPIFNLADVSVAGGGIMIMLSLKSIKDVFKNPLGR